MPTVISVLLIRLLNDSQPMSLILSERCAAAMHFNVLVRQMDHVVEIGLLVSI
jgi:hypothetical protein